MPEQQQLERCPAIRKNGQPCKAAAVRNGRCMAHQCAQRGVVWVAIPAGPLWMLLNVGSERRDYDYSYRPGHERQRSTLASVTFSSEREAREAATRANGPYITITETWH